MTLGATPWLERPPDQPLPWLDIGLPIGWLVLSLLTALWLHRTKTASPWAGLAWPVCWSLWLGGWLERLAPTRPGTEESPPPVQNADQK